MSCEDCKARKDSPEKEAITDAVKASRLTTDWLRDKEKTINFFKGVTIALVVALSIIAASMVWMASNYQSTVDRAVSAALEQSQQMFDEAM